MKTLTAMLQEHFPDGYVEEMKDVFKDWLRDVSLGGYLYSSNDSYKTRQELITMIDEP